MLSLIIPVYNGSKTISRVISEIESTIGKHVQEIILVNDCSPDNSLSICEELQVCNSKIKLITLRKNFGEHNAVLCGLNFMSADAAVILDDDLQHDPLEILKMYDKLQEGYDVVYGNFEKKQHSSFRNLGSKFNDIVATALLGKPKNLYLSSFKVLRKEVADEITKYKGPFPYIDGLILRVTRNISQVVVNHRAREEGESNYTIKKLISLWLNMFLNFSVLPLRIVTFAGFISFAIGIFFALYTIGEYLLSAKLPLGYASVFTAIMLFSGAQLISLGLIGEYLGKNYLDKNGTPQWVIKKKYF